MDRTYARLVVMRRWACPSFRDGDRTVDPIGISYADVYHDTNQVELGPSLPRRWADKAWNFGVVQLGDVLAFGFADDQDASGRAGTIRLGVVTWVGRTAIEVQLASTPQDAAYLAGELTVGTTCRHGPRGFFGTLRRLITGH